MGVFLDSHLAQTPGGKAQYEGDRRLAFAFSMYFTARSSLEAVGLF